MKLHPRVTQTAVDLVKRFEGFRPRAAKTPDGRFTIGYGHVLSPRDSAAEAEISQPEAEFLLKHDLSVTAEGVEEALLAPVNDNQFAALLSFAFNIGVENFKGSSAVQRLNEGAYLQAAAAIELWRRADFNGDALVVDQLVRRRAVEKALFLAPPEGFMPLPSSVLRPSFDHSVVGAAVAWAAARERTAVSRIALEGPSTAAELLTPPGREGEPAPSAAIAAADALAVRLSRILPDEPHETTPAEIAAPVAADHPFPDMQGQAVLTQEPLVHEPATDEPLADAAPVHAPEPEPAEVATAEEPAPHDHDHPAVVEDAAVAAAAVAPLAFADSAPHVETVAVDEAAEIHTHFDAAEQAAEPPPFVTEGDAEPTDLASWRRRFVTRSEDQPTEAEAPHEPAPTSLFGAPEAHQTPAFDDIDPDHDPDHDLVSTSASAAEVAQPAPPLFERPVFFVVLGLVGIALFIGSIFCMMNRASFACLLIGVLGVLAMAPAAAFFLFRFLGKPVDPAAPPHHPGLTQVADPEPKPVLTPVPDVPVAAANDSPFDSAWR